jgi:hypothetical protein
MSLVGGDDAYSSRAGPAPTAAPAAGRPEVG